MAPNNTGVNDPEVGMKASMPSMPEDREPRSADKSVEEDAAGEELKESVSKNSPW